MSESTGYRIANKSLFLEGGFYYNGSDMIINATITGMGKKDSFNNYPFPVLLKINNQTVEKLVLSDVSIWPKNNINGTGENAQQNGVSLSVFATKFENSFLHLLDNIQRTISEAVKTHNKNPNNFRIKPFYSSFEEGTPYFEHRKSAFEDKPENKGKVFANYYGGIDVSVYTHKETKIITTPISLIVDGQRRYVTGPEPLDRAVLEYYKKNESSVCPSKVNIFSIVYGMSLASLSRLSDEELSRRNCLLTEKTFVSQLTRMKAMMIFVAFNSIKSNTSRQFSSWKFNMTSLSVTPSGDKVSDSFDESEELLKSFLGVQDAPAEAPIVTTFQANPEEFDDSA